MIFWLLHHVTLLANTNCSEERAASIFRVQVGKVKGDGTLCGPVGTVYRKCDTRSVTVEWAYALQKFML
jgi:hypothetical protein